MPPESAQVHLHLWKDTLPLILNKISNFDKGVPKIRIYIERVGNLEPGINPVAGLLSNWKMAMGTDWVDIDAAKVSRNILSNIHGLAIQMLWDSSIHLGIGTTLRSKNASISSQKGWSKRLIVKMSSEKSTVYS